MSNGSKEGSGHPEELNGSPATNLPSLQQQELDDFWRKTVEDIENTMNFDNPILPMSCVEKIIRDKQGSFMVSPETPSFMTKGLEIFIQELSVRAWICAKSHDRPNTILESDIYEAINSRESYVFLNDVLQRPGTDHDQTSMFSNAPQLHQVHMILAQLNSSSLD
jgi:nuclear transcription factor Y gamma